MSAPRVGDLSVPRAGASNTAEGNGPEQASRQAPSPSVRENTQWWKPGDSVPLAVDDLKESLPNWFDGPITIWGIVDRNGTVFVFGSERVRNETLEKWEKTQAKFAPYRTFTLVEGA